MVIRDICEEDLLSSSKCAVQAFGGGITADDYIMPEERLIGAFCDDNKTLMARIELTEFQNYFGKGKLKCAGIGGVATFPQFRHMGAVRELFDSVFNEDYDISILYPFSTTYYRKFGYETAGTYFSAEMPFSELSDIKYDNKVVIVDKNNESEIIELYDWLSKKYNLCFERNSSKYFNMKPFDTSDYTYMHKDNDDTTDGYVSFSFIREQNLLSVKEIMFENKSALIGLLGFLRMFDANLNYIRFEKLPSESPIMNFVKNEGNVKRETNTLGSVRIIDLSNVLDMKIWPDEHGEFSMAIEDSIERNTGSYKITYSNGSYTMELFEGKPDIILDACAMSKIILCGTTKEEISYLNGVSINRLNSDFFKAFPKENTFFCDSF